MIIFTIPIILIVIMLVVGGFLLSELLPLIIGGIVMFVALMIILTLHDEGFLSGVVAALLYGLVFLVPGCIICMQTYDGYRALISRAWHTSGPSGLGICLVVFGVVIAVLGVLMAWADDDF